ncbi:hypothetical protein KFE25_007589 [Diacronema lutheri]|uniref:EamA domain-containing protein n=2 Tax=Diacronema lutheri TaxID=2081491 RepID=A0A8J6CFF7_DIALT|nr:hypothetical protein KFE25_007589 [Diacronema lutheri]
MDAAGCSPRRALPILAIVASSLGFSLQALLVKTIIVHGGVGTLEIIVVRGAMQGLFCVVALVLWRVPPREWLGTRRVQVRMLCLRSLLGFCGIAFGFYAISTLPLGDASTLSQTAPIWSSLMAVCFLGERWHCAEVLCALGALLGVALVMRPAPLVGLLGGDEAALAAAGASADPADGQRLLGSISGLCGAFAAGGVYVAVRWLGTVVRTPTPIVILYQALGQIVLAPMLVVASGQGWTRPSARHAALMLVIGCLGFASQCCLTYGLQREKSAVATPFKMTDVCFAFLWQATLAPPRGGERVIRATSIAGALVIVVSMVLNVCAKVARDRRGATLAQRLGGEVAAPEAMAPATPAIWDEIELAHGRNGKARRALSAPAVGGQEHDGGDEASSALAGGPRSRSSVAHMRAMMAAGARPVVDGARMQATDRTAGPYTQLGVASAGEGGSATF